MKIIFLEAVFLSLTMSSFSQEKNYYFNGVFNNDCYNGNIATNSAKKITIDLQNDGESLKYSIKSLGCANEEELINLGSFVGSETVYYNEDEKVGVILEGDNILYFIKNEDGKHSISDVAHTDKKLQKLKM